MNENAKKWVAALRSGEYQQGIHVLKKGDCFCCLGVACDLYQKEVGDLKVVETESGRVAFDGECQVLPSKVMRWLGVQHPNPELDDETEVEAAAYRNDKGESFARLADLFELNATNVFEASATLSESNDKQ